MPLPIIPVVAAAAFGTSGSVLGWYYTKSDKERAEADQAAADFIYNTYRTVADNLTAEQAMAAWRWVSRAYG